MGGNFSTVRYLFISGTLAVRSLKWLHILSLWAFLPLSNREFDLLTVGQYLKPVDEDGAEVYKNIGPVFLLDKPKPFGLVVKLNFSNYCVRHDPENRDINRTTKRRHDE